mgnify:CR=1 FL=1
MFKDKHSDLFHQFGFRHHHRQNHKSRTADLGKDIVGKVDANGRQNAVFAECLTQTDAGVVQKVGSVDGDQQKNKKFRDPADNVPNKISRDLLQQI